MENRINKFEDFKKINESNSSDELRNVVRQNIQRIIINCISDMSDNSFRDTILDNLNEDALKEWEEKIIGYGFNADVDQMYIDTLVDELTNNYIENLK